jgi:hypothetical protein
MEKLAAFIAEIRAAPAFIAAAGENPVFVQHLDNIERGFQALYREGTTDPWAIELFDRVRAAVGRKARIKPRLLQLEGLLLEWQSRRNRGKQ